MGRKETEGALEEAQRGGLKRFDSVEALFVSRETVMESFENLPNALMALFSGDNIGKQLVHIGD